MVIFPDDYFVQGFATSFFLMTKLHMYSFLVLCVLWYLESWILFSNTTCLLWLSVRQHFCPFSGCCGFLAYFPIISMKFLVCCKEKVTYMFWSFTTFLLNSTVFFYLLCVLAFNIEVPLV